MLSAENGLEDLVDAIITHGADVDAVVGVPYTTLVSLFLPSCVWLTPT